MSRKFVEFENVRQVAGEPRRRWFTCEDLELVIWCDDSGEPIGFQLCHNNERLQCALTWSPDCGFSHKIIDDGEERPGRYKATPILVADAPAVSAKSIRERFDRVSSGLPVEFARFVAKKLGERAKDITDE